MTVTESLAIVTSLESLAKEISNMNMCVANASKTSTTHTTFLDTYDPATPFEFSSWSISTAHANAFTPLSKIWYGQVYTFPSFISNVRICKNKAKLSSVAPHRIISAPTGGNTNRNILTKYQSITSVKIADAFTTYTNYCAIQNPKDFYAMLYKSINGTICDTIFEKSQNIPTEKDGVALLKTFMFFTVVTSPQLLILSFNQIMSILLSMYGYVIPTIKTKLTHLLFLTCMTNRILYEAKYI